MRLLTGRLLIPFKDAEELDQEEPGPPPEPCGDADPDPPGWEQKRTGRLAWGVYRTYWTAVGGPLAAAILMSLLLMQGSDPREPKQ